MLFELYQRWWSRRALARALRNPEYAEQYGRRALPDGGEIWIDVSRGLGDAELDRYEELWDEINPPTRVQRIVWWHRRRGDRRRGLDP
jgi:hypothetical protein